MAYSATRSTRAYRWRQNSVVSLSDQEQLDANVHLAYRFNRHWDAGIGYGIYDTQRDTAELKNDVSYEVLMTFVGYSFY